MDRPLQPSLLPPLVEPLPPKPRPEPVPAPLVVPLPPPGRPAPVVTTVIRTQTVSTVSSSTETRTVWLTNPNGSRTSVTLRAADGGMWVGPKGEYYGTFPTEAQLLPVYGLSTGAAPAGQSVEKPQTVWLTNPNGSRTPVELKPAGGGTWQGPKGEVYEKMPTEEQLLPVYGLK